MFGGIPRRCSPLCGQVLNPTPVSPVVDPIRPTHSGEVILGSCDGEILAFKRGDNSNYQPMRGFFLAGGAAGLALMAAFFGGQAVVNSRRKRRAERDAVEKWRTWPMPA